MPSGSARSFTAALAPHEGTPLIRPSYPEPGGSIPAVLVRGAQEDQVFLDVQRILKRARPSAR